MTEPFVMAVAPRVNYPSLSRYFSPKLLNSVASDLLFVSTSTVLFLSGLWTRQISALGPLTLL